MSLQNPHPLTPSGVNTCTDPQLSLNEEMRLSQLYEGKLRGLQQKVADLTQLYKESERDAENKLQFWQSKFISTLQTLQGNQTRVEGAEIEDARSEIERGGRERAELESNLLSVQNENYELTQGMLSERRDRDVMQRERDLAKRELCELRSQLVGREGELEDRERDNRTLVQRLEGLNQGIELLRRAVAARGRIHNRTNAPTREALDSESGELTNVRQEMNGLLDELTASREKIQSYEEKLASAREEHSSQSRLESDQVMDLQQRLGAAEVEIEECKARSDQAMRRKKIEFENIQREALECNQQLTKLLEKYSQLQQVHREKSVACEQLERKVADLSRALQTSRETQEQLVHSKQQDIDKLTGQLSKTNNKHVLTQTQLEALNQQLQLETDRVRNFEEKLKKATQDKEKLQREIRLTQESRILTSPKESPEGGHSCPYLSEDPLLQDRRTVGVMVTSLPVLNDKKNSPNFSQNYRKALQRGLSQVEVGESTSKLRADTDSSPDSKLYWVRRVSEMSLQMKESSEYWSAQVKELTIQLEQLKHSQTET